MEDLNKKLSTAVKEGNEEGLKLCIKEGANKDYKDEFGRTPLMIAAAIGHLEMIKYLISIFCNNEASNNKGRTPLMIAAGNGHLEVVKYLVTIGCNTEATSENGKTTLHFAAELGHLEVTQFLVESVGVNPLVRTNEGETPYHLAAKKGGMFWGPHKKVMKYLQGHTTYDLEAEFFWAKQEKRYKYLEARSLLSKYRKGYEDQMEESFAQSKNKYEDLEAEFFLPYKEFQNEDLEAEFFLPYKEFQNEMDNFTRIAMVVFNPLTDVLYDRLKLDRLNVPARRNVDIPYLYSEHRELNIHMPSSSNNRLSGHWGGTWKDISITDTAIGDDIERIRLIWDELRYSATQQLDDKRYKELFDIMHDLFGRFDQHNKPTPLYSDRLTQIIPKTSFVGEERNTFKESKRNIETEAAVPTENRLTDDKYSAQLYHRLLKAGSEKTERLKLIRHETTSDEEEHNNISDEEEQNTPSEIKCNRKTGSLLTTGIYCDGYFIDCDVHHSLIGSYRLFRKTWKGEVPISKLKLESINDFENLVIASTYLKIEQGCLSLLNEKSFLQAVDKSQDLLCRLMLSYIDDSETILDNLSKALKYAMSRRHVSISMAIAWRLTWTYFTKNKSAFPTLIDIWPAFQCTCTFESEYQNDICSSNAFIVVQLDTDVPQPSEEFCSIQILYFTNLIHETLPLVKRVVPFPDDMPITGSSAEILFDNHRNLTLICKSSFETSKTVYEPLNDLSKIIPCVELYCKVKGLIPIGEKHFPKLFCDLPTKVLQGSPTLMTSLQIGSAIGTDDFKKGTLGGFVRFRGEDAFLTCLHVFLKAEDLTSDDMTLDDSESYWVKCYSNEPAASSTNTGSSFVCGKIQDFGFEKNSDGTSIDAALIRLEKGITIDSSHFVAATGLESCYLNDICVDYKLFSYSHPRPKISTVSIGAITGISKTISNVNVEKAVDTDIEAFKKTFSDVILEGMKAHVVAVIKTLHSGSNLAIPIQQRIHTAIEEICGDDMSDETKEGIAEIVDCIYPKTLSGDQSEKINQLLHQVTIEKTSSKFSGILSDVHMQTTVLKMTIESAKRMSRRIYKQIYIPDIPFKLGDSGTCIYVVGPVKGCIGMAIASHPQGGCIATPIREILKYFKIRLKDSS